MYFYNKLADVSSYCFMHLSLGVVSNEHLEFALRIFEMSKFQLYALSGYSKVLGNF